MSRRFCLKSVVSDSLQPRGLQPTRLLCPWNSLGKNIGMDCHFLLQGIFPTQTHCMQICLKEVANFSTVVNSWE